MCVALPTSTQLYSQCPAEVALSLSTKGAELLSWHSNNAYCMLTVCS